MNKAMLVAALAAAASSNALAADFGVGVSVQSDDAWIYAPIDVTPKFRIEPSLRFTSSESEQQIEGTIFQPDQFVENESSTYEVAVGLFGLAPVHESVRLYYGVRAAYIDSESDLRVTLQSGSFEDVIEEELSSDGYRISPTLGFEYLINERFSIGGEAEWFYQELDIDRNTSLTGALSGESKANGTDTRLIVRFRF
jgi:hypothetical protein